MMFIFKRAMAYNFYHIKFEILIEHATRQLLRVAILLYQPFS